MISKAYSVFGAASVEEAPYKVLKEEKPFEIREYPALVVVETKVDGSFKKAGSKAFRRLFKYISGNNKVQTKIAMTAPVLAEKSEGKASGEKIEMTAPVLSQKDGKQWRYQFVLPKSYTLESAPKPLDPKVSLAKTSPRRIATIRYAWLASDSARKRHVKALLEWMDTQGLAPASEPRFAGYDPPWTLPPFRRNEVLIDIAN